MPKYVIERDIPGAGARIVQLEGLMHGPQRLRPFAAIHKDGNLDVAGGNHLHVDARPGQA